MRYSSGFGRHGARYVACRFENPPLLWEELGVVNVDEGCIGAVLTRKRLNWMSRNLTVSLCGMPAKGRHNMSMVVL